MGRELTIRSGKGGHLMAGEVEDAYRAVSLAPLPVRGKYDFAPVRRPIRICLLAAIFGKKPLRTAPLWRRRSRLQTLAETEP